MEIQNVFDVAIIEVISWMPHIGTGYEIAVREKKRGKSVVFFYIKNNGLEENWGGSISYTLQVNKRIENLKDALCYYNIPLVELDATSFDVKNAQKATTIFDDLNHLSSSEIKKYIFEGIEIGKSLLSSLIFTTNRLNVLPKDYKLQSLSMINTALSVANCMELILSQYKFKVVYSFNGRFVTCKPIFNLLKLNGVEFKTHERGAIFSKFNIFNGFPHEIELLWKMILEEKTNYLYRVIATYNFFKNQRNGKDLAWLSFVKHQTEKKWEIDSNGKKILTFYTSSDFEFEALDDLWPHTIFTSQFEAIKWLINYINVENKYLLIIKMHPNQKCLPQNEIQAWTEFNAENVKVILPDSPINSYTVMEKSDLIIGYGSTICMESSYWGKKAITVMQSYYSSNISPVVNEPTDLNELKNLLDNYDSIKVFPFKNFLKVGYWISSHGFKFKYFKPFNLFEGRFNYYKPYDIFKGRFPFLR